MVGQLFGRFFAVFGRFFHKKIWSPCSLAFNVAIDLIKCTDIKIQVKAGSRLNFTNLHFTQVTVAINSANIMELNKREINFSKVNGKLRFDK
jgi:hypothetical protein